MKMKFKHCRRKRIHKFLSGIPGKELTDLYQIFTAIAYLVYTGCRWKMLPRYSAICEAMVISAQPKGKKV